MSKNLNLKGLAFGALVALATSVVAPANAAGLADHTFVSLLPQTGTEYTVLADQTFDLKANLASSVAGGGNLKFQVVDTASQTRALAQSKFVADLTSIAYGSFATAGTLTDATVTVTKANTYQVGDIVTIAASSTLTAAVGIAGTFRISAVANDGSTFTYKPGVTATLPTAGAATSSLKVSRDAIIAASTLASEKAAIGGVAATSIAGTATTAGTLRNSAGSYVVSSENNTTASDKVLRLVSKSTATYSVKVTAWVDANGDNAIDGTEYASEERTVTFEKASDVTAVTTLSPIVGDTTLTAKVTTTPTLNGQQVLAQAPTFLNAAFTRQGDATTVYADNTVGTGSNQTAVWDDTNKYYSVVVDLDATSSNNASAADATTAVDSWATLVKPTTRTGTSAIASIAIAADKTVTVTTVADHNLLAGDKVTVSIDAADTGVAGATATAVAITVTGSKTFTYASPVTAAPTAATDSAISSTTNYVVATYATDHLAKADRVFAGDYTAQAVVQTGASTWTAAGAKVTASTAAATASTVTATTVAAAGVQGKSFTSTGSNTVAVKTGTTSVTVKFAVTDEDGSAVTAGRPVVVTLSANSGDTFKVNGKSTSDTVYTDASGTATVTVTALAGNVSAAVTATAVAEGVASASVDLAWADATVGIVDLSGTGAVDTSATLAVTRTIKKGGSYTLSLGAQDQFNTVADSAVYRFLVTGNGVSEAVKPLVAGKASVTITDTLGTALTTTIALQKLTGATWAAVNTWTVTTNLVTAPALSLGAKGVTTYGTAVVTSAPVVNATTSLDAVDVRSSSLINPSFGANYVVLNGAAQNSATSVGVVGQIVTVSGPASVLFSNGSVSAKGSLSFVSGASGLFEVKAYSKSAQTDSVITFTSEGVSKTIKVSFTGVSVGKTNVLTAAAGATTTQAGRAVDYTATVVDAQGNPVSGFALKATIAGAGYFAGSVNSSGAVETTTDIYGKAVVKVLYSTQDAGTATVTFADNDDSTATADNLKSIVLATEIGATDANIDIVGKRVTAVASFSKGKTVAFYVDGIKKWSKTSASDADVVLNYNLKKGTHTVTVKISGGFVTTEKFIVK